MDLTFPVLAIMGVMLLFVIPRRTLPWKRKASHAAAVALISLGVIGTVHSALELAA